MISANLLGVTRDLDYTRRLVHMGVVNWCILILTTLHDIRMTGNAKSLAEKSKQGVVTDVVRHFCSFDKFMKNLKITTKSSGSFRIFHVQTEILNLIQVLRNLDIHDKITSWDIKLMIGLICNGAYLSDSCMKDTQTFKKQLSGT